MPSFERGKSFSSNKMALNDLGFRLLPKKVASVESALFSFGFRRDLVSSIYIEEPLATQNLTCTLFTSETAEVLFIECKTMLVPIS